MGSVPITAGSGTPIRTLSNVGVDAGANQQIVTLADDDGDFLHTDKIPSGYEDGLMVRALPTQVSRTGFSMAVANAVDTDFGAVIKTGSGQTVNQTGGNLVLTTGTTVNAETIIRSTLAWAGAVRCRVRNTLSQRIANQSFFVEMVDVLGDNLAVTIASATALTVTFATNPFTAANIGQFMYLGGYVGTGTFIPGRYAIASVSGNTVTYTVAGFAAGSGTCSVFGWNYHHLLYDGVTATNAKWDTQRKGWNTGDTVIGTNASSAPGHIAVMTHNDMQAAILDATVANNTAVQYSVRGSRVENVPDDIPLRVQIRVVNGTVAPTATTTWTIGQIAVSNWSAQDVTIQDVRPQPPTSALPVQINNTPTVSVNNGVTTVTTRPDGAGATAFAGETTAAVFASAIKVSAGTLYELTVSNLTASDLYVKLYNKASAGLPASDTPVHTFKVTANSDRQVSFGSNGKRFPAGIAIGMTGLAVKTDTTALVAGSQISGTYV